MTRVDFYVLPGDGGDDPLPTTCRLCDKASQAGKRVHVHVPNAEQSGALDRLLWTFRQGSFVSHERAAEAGPTPPDVLLGDGDPVESHLEVLINLGPDVPTFFSRFERVLEIVYGDDATRTALRERFKWYRDRGYAPESHPL